MDSSLVKYSEPFLKVTQANRLKDKKVDDYVKGFTSKRWHRQTLMKRKRKRIHQHFGLHGCSSSKIWGLHKKQQRKINYSNQLTALAILVKKEK